MAKLRKKNFGNPDVRRDVGRGELQVVELGDVAIGRIEYQPGWRWSEDLGRRIGTGVCEVHHIGVAISGRLVVEMRDGSTMVIEPNDAFEIPPGHDAYVLGEEPWVSIDTVGRRNFGAPPQEALQRYLATILFVDIVESTEHVRRIGDRAWRDLLADYYFAVGRVLERYHGIEVDRAGDGLLATFDSPARGIRAAGDIAREAAELGLKVRAGLHTGEVERAGDDVRGIAVHHAARVASAGAPGEIVISSATRALMAGADIPLEPMGSRTLKGIDAPDELFRVDPAFGRSSSS